MLADCLSREENGSQGRRGWKTDFSNGGSVAAFARFKKSENNRSLASDLDRTSTHRQLLRNCLRARLSLSGLLSLGVPFVAIRKRAFNGSSLRYGGSFSINSIAIMPNDQTSTFGPYSFCLTTSGAIQYGVPTIVALLFLSWVSLAQKPKSAGGRRY